MLLEAPNNTVIYTIEKAIKSYRKFAQKNLNSVAKGITVDQGLVLIMLDQNPKLTQKEMAQLIFKDDASMTRIINLMVTKKYLEREIHQTDRRRFHLKISTKGKKIIAGITPVIKQNRATALKGMDEQEITQLYRSLNKIIVNCCT